MTISCFTLSHCINQEFLIVLITCESKTNTQSFLSADIEK